MRTPGPWALEPSEQRSIDGSREFKIVTDRPGGGLVGSTSAWWYDTETARDNAAFIVEACNSHDALTADNARLREALAGIMRRVDSAMAAGDCPGDGVSELLNAARAALAGGEK